MKSVDTNILIYASNQDAPEYQKARGVVEMMVEQPSDWILADQVLIEFYRALRNPKIFQYPLDASAALEIVNFYREQVGCQRCCYQLEMWPVLARYFDSRQFEAKQTFDGVLAVTLTLNGVDTLYTRNVKDFKSLGFNTLINPIDE
jgi:predicted nucleic acid-binding protein